MKESEGGPETAARSLDVRARALRCLYRVDELLVRREISTEELVRGVLAAIPEGFEHSELCVARALLRDRVFEPAGFAATPWRLAVPLVVQGETTGRIEVYYREARPQLDEGPFLDDERRLLETIAEHLASVLARRRLRKAMNGEAERGEAMPGWRVILEFLRQTDRAMLGRLGRKLLNHLAWSGVEEAGVLLRRVTPKLGGDGGDDNRPLPVAPLATDAATAEAAFRLAAHHLEDPQLIELVQGWIKEEKSAFLKHAVERIDTPIEELLGALERFREGGVDEADLTPATQLGLRASLARRFLTDQLEFVDNAKRYLRVDDFVDLGRRLVYPPRSHGRIGGKSAGLFLATRVLEREGQRGALPEGIRTPRSWYLPSDGILDFIQHNDLGEVHSRKYDDVDRVRREYPHVVQLFKSSILSPDVLRGLSSVLDDLEGRPVIVRSSSLLEDRLGSAFSGKYKSLFLANVGTRRERLASLADAIAEVYASIFSPDPIEYRARRGFLDLHEEMGILIQEVVGRRIGRYWLPAFSGVGFSHNEFRWSPRIRREDGLLRLVPGLGTRAVDRLADDYPVLVAPGQPGLRVTQTADEALRYSPKKMDVIDLESRSFATIDVRAFLAEHGERLPLARQLVSLVDHDRLRRPRGLIDFAQDPLLVTFEGLLADGTFLPRMRSLLTILHQRLGTPVDLEFACDGEDVYLLQCRPQQATPGAVAAEIPADLPRERVLFSAHRFVSNGLVDDVRWVIYVDPDGYGRLSPESMVEVGRAVGRLNRMLPKKSFVLMGPGRWGSRGDVRLGVPVTYADLSGTAVLIEIARQKGGYVPDLSFGTHFFQDLVESSIRYLPLYPDEPGVVFREAFFLDAANSLAELSPGDAALAGVLRVIDVPRASGGSVLRVLMSAERETAVGVLAAPVEARGVGAVAALDPQQEARRFRLRMAEALAAALDRERLGVAALARLEPLRESTDASPSPLELVVGMRAGAQEAEARLWLEGFVASMAAAERQRTGRDPGAMPCDFRFVRVGGGEARGELARALGVSPARLHSLE